MINTSQNPMGILVQMSQNNPLARQVLDIVKQYGGDADKAFSAYAAQSGFSIDDVRNLMNG